MKIAAPPAMQKAAPAALQISPNWKPIFESEPTYYYSEPTDSQQSSYSSGIGTEDVNKYSSDSQSQPSSEDDDFTEELTGYIQTGVNIPIKRSSSSPHAFVGTESPSKRRNSPRASPFKFVPSTINRSSSVIPPMNNEHHQRPPSWSRSLSAPTHHGDGDYGGGTKTRKNKTKKQNKTRKQKPKKQTKRISYVKNKQTRKKSKTNKNQKQKRIKNKKNPIQKNQHKNT